MAIAFADRVKENSTITGVGPYVLGGPLLSFQGFSVIGDGNQCAYAATDGTDWETGLGTFVLASNHVTRDTIYESSNAGAAVNWGAGNKVIYNTPLSEYARQQYFQSYVGINAVTASSYTLQLSDQGKIVELSDATSVALTIPLDAAVNFPLYTRIEILQTGLGTVTVSHAGTLWGFTSTGGQYYCISMHKRAADHWVLIGGVP